MQRDRVLIPEIGERPPSGTLPGSTPLAKSPATPTQHRPTAPQRKALASVLPSKAHKNGAALGRAYAALDGAREQTCELIDDAIARGMASAEARTIIENELSCDRDFLRSLGFHGCDEDR